MVGSVAKHRPERSPDLIANQQHTRLPEGQVAEQMGADAATLAYARSSQDHRSGNSVQLLRIRDFVSEA